MPQWQLVGTAHGASPEAIVSELLTGARFLTYVREGRVRRTIGEGPSSHQPLLIALSANTAISAGDREHLEQNCWPASKIEGAMNSYPFSHDVQFSHIVCFLLVKTVIRFHTKRAGWGVDSSRTPPAGDDICDPSMSMRYTSNTFVICDSPRRLATLRGLLHALEPRSRAGPRTGRTTGLGSAGARASRSNG